MIETVTDFPYLGDRDYIHGTSILGGFIAALEAQGARSITIGRLKFQRPAKSNGRMVLTPGPLDDADSARANCTLVAAVDGATWRGLFVEDGGAVPRRLGVSYPIDDLDAAAFGGHCRISPASRDDLIRAIVEANKRFHEASIEGGKAAVRFGYLENWPVPPADVSFSGGELSARNLIARKSDAGYMTINRLTYDGGAARASLTLCFEAHPAAPE